MSYSQSSDWSKCTQCGECLAKCPILNIDAAEAKQLVGSLLHGRMPDRLYRDCRFCFNCNRYCPEGLRIHELILENAFKRRGRVPAALRYLMNGKNTGNLWMDLYSKLGASEQKILQKWAEPPESAGEMLFVGCIGKLSCRDLDNSSVLQSLPKFGPRDICCGELAYRLGSWDDYARTIERTLERFETLRIKRMVCYCGSCYNFLSNILPHVYGKSLPFKLISLYGWLWEKLQEGKLEIKNPLRYRAAVHESYYVSELDETFREDLYRLYGAAGIDTVEMDHHGINNLPCGAVSGITVKRFLLNPLLESPRRYREAKKAGAVEMAVHCPGCYMALGNTSRLHGVRLHYMAEELLVAFGDTVENPLAKIIPRIVKEAVKRLPAEILRSRR